MRFQVAVVAGLLAVSGCTTTSLGRNDAGSAPAAGGRTGSGGAIASAIIDEMAGGLVGGSIGAGLDSGERRSALEAEYRALEHTPSGQVVTWRGDGNRYGEVVAAQPYRVGSQDCRQYKHSVFVSGQPRSARGTACRNADGSWTPLT
jgi:surface antigen